ncbi:MULTISPECIES: YbgC/FadM family acyl-CoA thioesterase [unclassified Oceanispirochaeta]|uniref:YbgC/FadM family acyl-CoA thioesterase n=1 Tax=unclassified Oceanispirochaeta TaxID=2635722 RepID=UPI000E09B4DE|nr:MULTISPECIES: YbgC/FadM family acyl-CoA thioesterase [unclassified Oceanispirochaeta]MBF9015491.1 YbgC/FadM family acyl-CoA thioesterase [Oceanispirochaeta sp. M2]NPD71950.1 YbgC/FadM family acyl-CoA thioesterase [Oceanispirochaeta sp. M1]RDG32757.1 tol-pal system-associated acyl-CoA thioesterase [Oceanispirochaeta sp. M1]
MEDNLSGTIQDNTHNLLKRVYYSDTDAGGVVYHSRYIEMAEHARSELIRLLGGEQRGPLQEQGIGFVVRSLNVSYNRPAFLDDTLTIKTSITKCETFTLIFDQNIYREEELLCEIKVKTGCVSLSEGKPTAMPKDWQGLIREKMLSSKSNIR